MLFILSTLFSGIFSGLVSIFFREYELKNDTIAVGRQFVLQLLFLIIFLMIFYQFFSGYTLVIGNFLTLSWFFIYFVFSSLSYYMVQILYEWFTGITLFPSDMEVEEYIEKHMK